MCDTLMTNHLPEQQSHTQAATAAVRVAASSAYLWSHANAGQSVQ